MFEKNKTIMEGACEIIDKATELELIFVERGVIRYMRGFISLFFLCCVFLNFP